MKKSIKFLSLIITFVMVLSLCACSGEKEVSTGGEFTYWNPLYSTTSHTQSSYNEMMMYQEMAKATGINVKFIHPSLGSTGSEAFQVLLASGDYPDMIEYHWKTYTGGPGQAIDDGVIIALNDYLEEYAPNYFDYMEGDKAKEKGYLYKVHSSTIDGDYYGFTSLYVGTYKSSSGLYVRKDLLDKWNLDVPQTIDDWENVFKTAKENGVEKPFTGEDYLLSFTGSEVYNIAWNVGKNWFIDDGKVKFGPFEANYKDYIAKLADWTKKGYIDKDYITNDWATVQGNMTNGTSIATYGGIGGGMGGLLPAMEERNPEYDLVACPYPVMKKGDVPHNQWVVSAAIDPAVAISVSCGAENEERYKEAIKWCDYFYSEEGTILKCFGIEGDTYTIQKDEDGVEHYMYTDKIRNHEVEGANSVADAIWHFMRPANAPGINQLDDYMLGFYPYEQQIHALHLWNEHADEAEKHVMPPLQYTNEELSKKATIEANCNDNLEAGLSNIIIGKASIDTYDDIIEQAKKGGYADLLKIQQAAYDRYLNLINNSK